MSERLVGLIERVTFHSPETGFSVLRVKVPQRADLVTVVGTLSAATVGEHVDAEGRWVVNREHGQQFEAATLKSHPPTSPKAIERYLGSGAIKGLGPQYAAKIVKVFQEKTLEILDKNSGFLLDVRGIGPKRLESIRKSWREQQAVREIMVFLHQHGIGASRAVRIHRTYGEQAIEVVRGNPYRLADDIAGVGFRTADELARSLGLRPDSPERARAAMIYTLKELTTEGHCAFPERGVVERTAALVELAPERLTPTAQQLVDSRAAVRETVEDYDWLYDVRLYRSEVGLAESVRRLSLTSLHPFPKDVDVEALIAAAEVRQKVTLADAQREALRLACRRSFVVVTGGPGVGKTTLVRCLLDVFQSQDLKCVLAAPTGRAAKRMTEATGHPSQTIHRLLEYDPANGGFKKNHRSRLAGEVFVLDEASMIDVVLGNQLLRAIPTGAVVVFVGDVDQLPSVGPGTVLADLIGSAVPAVVRLTHIFRQGEGSRIVAAAHSIHRGEIPETPANPEGSDFFFWETEVPEAIEERVVRLVKERIPQKFGFDPLKDVQVLAPMNRGRLGARSLNAALQAALNPTPREINRFGWSFRVGDRVLQTRNNYDKDVFNGDLGIVRDIKEVDQDLIVDFDGRSIPYDFAELDELALAYCMTIHKSQGSEYPCVVLPLHTQHFALLQRNLLYTGVTRGKKLVVIVGSRRALSLAVSKMDAQRRCTALRGRITHALRPRDNDPDLWD